MEALLKFLENLVSSGNVSGIWLGACVGVASLGGLVFYGAKGINLLMPHFKMLQNRVSKEDIKDIKDSARDDNKNVLKLLDDVSSRLKVLDQSSGSVIELSKQLESEIEKVANLTNEVKFMQANEASTNLALQKDLNNLMSDSRAQYVEISRQIQALQVDLASLHGTLLGLSSHRNRLK